MIYRKDKGFTLIELLVVIAIIGILAAVIIVALGGTRPRARDARRKQDLESIRTAVATWLNANDNVVLNATGCAQVPTNVATALVGGCWTQSGASALVPTYLGSVPTDPSPNIAPGFYQYDGNGTDSFTVGANLEQTTTFTSPAPCTGFAAGIDWCISN